MTSGKGALVGHRRSMHSLTLTHVAFECVEEGAILIVLESIVQIMIPNNSPSALGLMREAST